MTNPITLVAPWASTIAWFEKSATQAQRVTLKSSDGKIIHVEDFSGGKTFDMRVTAGTYTVEHETLYYGTWRKGLGRSPHPQRAEFDDNPDGLGDNDYNDAIVLFLNPN